MAIGNLARIGHSFREIVSHLNVLNCRFEAASVITAIEEVLKNHHPLSAEIMVREIEELSFNRRRLIVLITLSDGSIVLDVCFTSLDRSKFLGWSTRNMHGRTDKNLPDDFLCAACR